MQTHDYLREAKIFFATGQLEKSIEFFTLAYEQGGEPVAVCLSRGAAAMALGHYREAAEDFSRVLPMRRLANIKRPLTISHFH
jgi:tetratricopeptide (TPR) repeat protein